MPRYGGDGEPCVSAFLCVPAYQAMFIPRVMLAFELSGIISLLVLPSMWSIPMKRL